ncbi:MAG: hypothetical protein KDC85_18380 [Saprospiraceae bacterium]|nr:hypothetical protein [Saprospiraceae bacterium]MCB9322840.1 thioredoxin [Lewinellaceae bacterium]
MNLIKRTSFWMVTSMVMACNTDVKPGQETTASSGNESQAAEVQVLAENRVEVIDFYGTHRCITCKAIEANAQYTVETFFKEELKTGRVIFKTVNVDAPENYKIAELYEATGTALYLNVVKAGQETHIDLTEQAFENGRDKAVFSDELKFFIENELSSLN